MNRLRDHHAQIRWKRRIGRLPEIATAGMMLAVVVGIVCIPLFIIHHTRFGTFGLHWCLRVTGAFICIFALAAFFILIEYCLFIWRRVYVCEHMGASSISVKTYAGFVLQGAAGWILLLGVVGTTVLLWRRPILWLTQLMWWTGMIAWAAVGLAPILAFCYFIITPRYADELVGIAETLVATLAAIVVSAMLTFRHINLGPFGLHWIARLTGGVVLSILASSILAAVGILCFLRPKFHLPAEKKGPTFKVSAWGVAGWALLVTVVTAIFRLGHIDRLDLSAVAWWIGVITPCLIVLAFPIIVVYYAVAVFPNEADQTRVSETSRRVNNKPEC